MTKRLGDLASELGTPCRPEWQAVSIEGVTDDSRQVLPGVVFVAHRGTHDDGHDHVADAIARGAAAVVSERPLDTENRPSFVVADGRVELARWAAAFYDHPTRRLRTVGVTGTNGKTSVCHFVAHLVGSESAAVVGTVENLSRGLRALTTPPSPAVQRIAHEAVAAGKTTLVLEASSVGLEQHRLDEIAFDVGVFTNLTRDHLDLHGTIEAYGAAKAILFRRLPPSAVAVLNGDDPYSETLRQACRCRVLSYGLRTPADLHGEVIGEDPSGIVLSLARAGDETARATVPVHGPYGASNALAALGAALSLGIPWATSIERLSSLPPVAGRWNLFRRTDGADAIVDFAHTPDGLFQILSVVRRLYARVVIVFGCAGGSDRGKRSQMGEIASRFADVVVLTQDNPKYEEPEAILDEIEAGIPAAHPAIRIVDRRQAIEDAVHRVGRGDVLLLAGKGHETFQIVRGEFLPHSDAAILTSLGFVPVSPEKIEGERR